MNWLSGLSTSEKDEMFLDSCEAFSSGIISESEYRETLARLGFNATDIEGYVKEHAFLAPENDGD